MDWLFKGADSIYETCWFITLASGIGGAYAAVVSHQHDTQTLAAGTAGGFGFGVFIGTLEGGHGSIHDASFKEQVSISLKYVIFFVPLCLVQLRVGFKRTIKNSAKRGVMFAKVRCACCRTRARLKFNNTRSNSAWLALCMQALSAP